MQPSLIAVGQQSAKVIAVVSPGLGKRLTDLCQDTLRVLRQNTLTPVLNMTLKCPSWYAVERLQLR